MQKPVFRHQPVHSESPAPHQSQGDLSRRRMLALLGMLPIAGCSSSPVLSPVLSQAAEQFAVVTGGMKGAPVTRAYVEKLPYASMLARIGKGPQSLVILYQQQKEVLSWIAADRTVMVTRHGRILQTGGLEKGIAATFFVEPDPLPGIAARGSAAVHRMIDLPYRQQFSVLVTGTLQPEGNETVTILDRTFTTVRYREKITARQIDWEAENLFWIDQSTGTTIKTRQYLTPDLPVIETALTKSA